jgi:hypothetical protein
MHVRGQGSSGGAVSEPALFTAHLRQRHAVPAELLGNGDLEIAGGPELFEVLTEESVLSIVGRGPFAATADDLLGKHGHGCHGCTSFRSVTTP